MTKEEIESLRDLDRCLRFFYLCTVIQTDLKIERSILARSYYWYMKELADKNHRPELHDYLSRNYKRLHEWLTRHQPCFDHYAKTGEWNERKALS